MGEEADFESSGEIQSDEYITEKEDSVVIEEEKSTTRRLRIFCPVCGMLSPDKRYLVEHPFPNVMEYHYKGRGKIDCDYVLDDNEDVRDLVESVSEQIISVIKNNFTMDQMRNLNRQLVRIINNFDEEND
tara:strand:- start:121 stop:510 length:390 start_codon:yes stop_codon:yes gene_type:complete